MSKVSTNLTVSTENDRDLQITTAMFGDVISILAQNNLSYNLGSYEVVDEIPELEELQVQELATWEQELLASGHSLENCSCIKKANAELKEETHEPGFPYEIMPPESEIVQTAKFLVADMINDQTGLSYSHSSFEPVSANLQEDGWVVILKCKDRGEYRYEVTRVTYKDETHIEQYKYDRAITIVGS
jgi:hypothetical protein